MDKAYLTADEIYAIDNLDDVSLVDFISPLPQEKKELVLHVFSKIRNLRLSRVLLAESEEHSSNLENLLEENGVKLK
jgi:hypothetical protein